jgi:hypothetical protein
MKTWLKKYEWMIYAACVDNPIHTAEMGTPIGGDGDWSDIPGFLADISEAQEVCDSCIVRPECIEWALSDNASGVVVAGVYLPDPANKKELRNAHAELRKSLPLERERRGDV